mmetsp:Transcript_124225/g.362621  ORF Transcript_124225/g.362621 Transcript_124225/m.362621 type:complete len:201 (-) Transcript_124225:2138-2740(-)
MCSRRSCWMACWPSPERPATSALRPWGSARASCTRHCARGERWAPKLPGCFAVWSAMRSATRRTKEVVASASAPGELSRWPSAAAVTAPQAASTAGAGRPGASCASAATSRGSTTGQSAAQPGLCSRLCAEEAAVCATLALPWPRPRAKTSRTWARQRLAAAFARSLDGAAPSACCSTVQSAETVGTSSAQVSTTLRSAA